MKSIKTLLTENTSFSSSAWQWQLASHWPDIMGNLTSIVSLEKLYGTTLILGVYEQSWIAELHMLSNVIIKTIHEHIKGIRIEKIIFKYVQKTKKEKQEKKKHLPAHEFAVNLTSQEHHALRHIKDSELKEYLTHFLLSCKKRRAYHDLS